jgi:hypothetical protein
MKALSKFLNGVTIVTLGFYIMVSIFLYKVLFVQGIDPTDYRALGWIAALILVILMALGDNMFMKLHKMYCDKCDMFDIAVNDAAKLTKEIKRLKNGRTQREDGVQSQ